MDETWVVVSGSLYEGLTHVYGPFSSETAAEDWRDVQPWDDGVEGYVFRVLVPTDDEYTKG